jgi:hypothetical protein
LLDVLGYIFGGTILVVGLIVLAVIWQLDRQSKSIGPGTYPVRILEVMNDRVTIIVVVPRRWPWKQQKYSRRCSLPRAWFENNPFLYLESAHVVMTVRRVWGGRRIQLASGKRNLRVVPKKTSA